MKLPSGNSSNLDLDQDIAIVGIGCRFPGGANDPETFWGLLKEGFNAVTEAPLSRPGFRDLFDPDPKKAGRTYSRWGGFLEHVDLFDAQFFGISPREAARIDPQHRLLLEMVWEACEDAGIPPPTLAGSRTGVFIGISTHDYGDIQLYPQNRAEIDMYTNSGSTTSIAANRISYLYDFRGPSMAVDTACSSALTAVHLACQSLHAGESIAAIAGGVQVLLAPEATIGFSKASMLSPDGQCRAFDAGANGYVRSEGGGVVLLKPLRAALDARDPVYAVIRATAVNQDGHTNGMTVPSPAAQQAMIEEALAQAGITARDVQYVEAHGTGTPTGDPIEARALGSVMSPGRGENEFCAIGSVKTNIGHLEAASGMAGLIKTALSLRHRRIPPSLHFRQVNSAIDLNAYRLRVVTELEPWPSPDRPPIAGVNSFGFGGANAHVILQGAPQDSVGAVVEAAHPRLLAVSAKTPDALKELAAAYGDSLNDSPLRDVCYTAAERRAHHDCRLAVVAANKEEFASYLSDFISGAANANVSSGRIQPGGHPKIGFVFTGMGPQWWGMGRQLRATEPVFRRTLEQCDAALRPISGWSLLDEFAKDEAASRIDSPELAQVTNLAIQAALVDLWASWGIQPDAVIGHSGGAMSAAYAAGIYDLEDVIRLAFHRSRLAGRPSNAGRMLAVGAPFADIEPLLAESGGSVTLSAVNGPRSITLTGDGVALEQIRATLEKKQIFARILSVTIAYHSAAMDKIKDEFLASIAGLRGRSARIPFVSDLTGNWEGGEECDAQYWWHALREPVRFHDGINRLLDADIANFVEIGPHPVLRTSIVECMNARGVQGLVVPTIRRAEDEGAVMRRSLGGLYTNGCKVNWAALREDGARVAALPHYPWQRERHWFEPSAKASTWSGMHERNAGDHPLLGTRLRSARPCWESLVGAGDTEYLQEHLVQGSPVYPGAAYVEMALASRMPIAEEAGILLQDVELLRPLLIHRDSPKPVQFSLDPEEGRFEIFASTGEAAAWICHARGRVAPLKSVRPARVDLDLALKRIGIPVAPETFYARVEERGLSYGPLFRGIRNLWAANRQALAFVTTDGRADCSGYNIHPALLDAAFQAIIASIDSDPSLPVSERLLLPFHISEVRFHAPPGDRFWAIFKITEALESEVSGDIQIASEDGDLCVEIRGFRTRLVDPTARGTRDSIDQWLYDYRWEPMPLVMAGSSVAEVSGHLPLKADLEEFRRRADALSAETAWHLYHEKVEGRLNELAAAYIAEAALSRETESAGGWRQMLAKQSLEILQRIGRPRADAATLAAELLRDFPGYRFDIELLRRCGPHLAEVVAGRADGHEVLFAGDGYGLLEQFYRESPGMACYNALTANLVADFASAFDGVRPMRVLEVGAGTGGTTAHILPRLDAQNTSYVFSDVSTLFLDRARAKFSHEYPFLSTRLFDITRSPAAQGLEAGSFDLILAVNVLHAMPEVEPCVERLRELLTPAGALVLVELTNHPYWTDIIFGLMDGWWRFEDRDRRPNHPLMTGRQWQSLLEECHFETPSVAADSAPGEPAQSIIFGRRGAEQNARAAKRWLVFADAGGVGKRLASVLAEHAIESTLVRSGEADLSRLSEEARSGAFEGIVHLWSLDAPHLDETIAGDRNEFETAPSLGCASVLSILQRVVQDSPLAERGLVLVTAGAQWPPGLVEPSLLQTPLWGLGRVIRREWPHVRCRMMDLSAECTNEEVAALAREILNDTGEDVYEDEVAFRNDGRFVHRLRPVTLAQIADAAPVTEAGPEDKWQADMPTGLLDSIVLKRTERGAPAPHQVEVAIRAASLNFHDIIVGMRAIAGLERSWLGIDFAGTVTRCGDAVKHLRPGDEVFGVAEGTLASYALTHSALAVPRPSRITVEQASAIPIAFLTAHYAIRNLARLSKGESVLIHVASGGVGHAAIQIARACGARIFATAGSPAKRSYLESLGITDVMDSRSLTFADEIAERTGGRGVDVVLNSLTGEALERGIASLAPCGRFVELGKADIYRNNRVQLLPFKRNLTFFALDLLQIGLDRPEFIGSLLNDLAKEFASGALHPIPYTEFPMKELGGAMRFMAQAKHIGKVVVSNKAPVDVLASLPERPPVRPDATYLITGGLGGVGLLTARWLAERGARSLVLVGRNPPSLETEARLEDLRDTGARVEVLAADVSKSADVARVLEFIRANLSPLRGILHAAMVLSDTPLANLDEGGLTRVMAPKVLGAWNLHRQTMGENLDFFLSFSSLASTVGSPLQANYAAANAFLDAFAVYRRARGLPATTVNFGVLAGSGWVARQNEELMNHLNRQGFESFTEEQTLRVVSELLRHNAVNLTAARMDWKLVAESNPRAARWLRIRHLIPSAEGKPVASAAGSIRAVIEGEDPAARMARLEQYLREQVARLLGALPSAIEPERPITDFGLDSLIAVELATVLERDLDVQIAGTKLLSGISTRALAQDIGGLLGFDAEPPGKVAGAGMQEPAVETAEQPAPTAALLSSPATVRQPARSIPAVETPPAAPMNAQSETPVAVSVKNGTDYRALDYGTWDPGHRALQMVATAGFRALGRIETEGLENIPRDGPCLLAVNHLSMADGPLVLTLLKRRAIPVVNGRLKQNRVLHWLLSDMGQAIYVTRNQTNEESLERALAVLRAGGMLILAPEGTRSKTGGLLRGKTGVAWLATRIDVPVVPLAAWGQEKWRELGRRFGRIPIHVRAGAQLRLPQGAASPEAMRRYTDLIMDRLAALLPPAYRGVYAHPDGEDRVLKEHRGRTHAPR